VVLSDTDRNLLQRCLGRKPRAWEDFVDRYLGLVLHVVNHTAQSRSIRLTTEDVEDLSAEVFLSVVNNDFEILRRFRGESSLATYLTVVARRVVVRQMLKRKPVSSVAAGEQSVAADADAPLERITNKEEVARLLEGLAGSEAMCVQMFHLEGKSYAEIAEATGIAPNSIGPTLTRARDKMRKAATG